MAPTLILIRHAEALHNLTSKFLPLEREFLTNRHGRAGLADREGRQNRGRRKLARKLREALRHRHARRPRRARAQVPDRRLQHAGPGVPGQAVAGGRGLLHTRGAILARGQAVLRRLRDRPEKVVIVVSHSGFLRLGVSGCFCFNADYRIFDFEEEEAAGGDGAVPQIIRLKQWEETEEKGRWDEQELEGHGRARQRLAGGDAQLDG
ncbi:phosphoglycerate mutase-like protein [Apiospora phragmitis]|uniref:Phosphoglycerate mutase-like protein n=1 Tax=Apiospora phragmitis TaxID=2905665 RepID=A0ABR1W7K2_9PEZI